ncbi:MAG: hypothetical protein KKG03_03465 [Gammaproteobacteria bacterium]|nr:hypothetical protein [Sideroxydans sp.]MBU4150691.1 hypothetical protein [Gammaproteobacteria bacterium]
MNLSDLRLALNAISLEVTHEGIPPVFCWTKMGTEAGQSLDMILRRKELERRAGQGLFAWGIGNSLGVAATLARQEALGNEVEVLFTPMRSAAKHADVSPTQVLLWLGYHDENGVEVRLPSHMMITSRGSRGQKGGWRSHYALLCEGRRDITIPANLGAIDANNAKNFASLNPLGASQVTAVVRYKSTCDELPERRYPVAFRAKLHGLGFVRLASPVVLDSDLLSIYHQVCRSETVQEWIEGTSYLRQKAEDAKAQKSPQKKLFGEILTRKTRTEEYVISSKRQILATV